MIAFDNGRPVLTTQPLIYGDDDPDVLSSKNRAFLLLLHKVMAAILATNNSHLAAQCFSLVTGIGYQGESMTQIAKTHGISRAAVSKRCIKLARAFNLPPRGAMRKESTREACRRARYRVLRDKNPA